MLRSTRERNARSADSVVPKTFLFFCFLTYCSALDVPKPPSDVQQVNTGAETDERQVRKSMSGLYQNQHAHEHHRRGLIRAANLEGNEYGYEFAEEEIDPETAVQAQPREKEGGESTNSESPSDTSSAVPVDRIVKGNTVTSAETYAWYTQLYGVLVDSTPQLLRRRCGATLISPQFILTAGHCVVESSVVRAAPTQVSLSSIPVADPSIKWYAEVGYHTAPVTPFSDSLPSSSDLIEVATIYIHPDYREFFVNGNRQTVLHDLAILKLSGPVPSISADRYAIPDDGTVSDSLTFYDELVIVGNGAVESGSFSPPPSLQSLNMHFVPARTCELWVNLPQKTFEDATVCVKAQSTSAGMCFGDSGAAVIKPRDPSESSSRDILVGIPSMLYTLQEVLDGTLVQSCDIRVFPDVAARVGARMAYGWIRAVVCAYSASDTPSWCNRPFPGNGVPCAERPRDKFRLQRITQKFSDLAPPDGSQDHETLHSASLQSEETVITANKVKRKPCRWLRRRGRAATLCNPHGDVQAVPTSANSGGTREILVSDDAAIVCPVTCQQCTTSEP